jgi:hypothetical protein
MIYKQIFGHNWKFFVIYDLKEKLKYNKNSLKDTNFNQQN